MTSLSLNVLLFTWILIVQGARGGVGETPGGGGGENERHQEQQQSEQNEQNEKPKRGRVKAVFSYVAAKPDEISLRRGQLVTVIETHPSSWWTVRAFPLLLLLLLLLLLMLLLLGGGGGVAIDSHNSSFFFFFTYEPWCNWTFWNSFWEPCHSLSVSSSTFGLGSWCWTFVLGLGESLFIFGCVGCCVVTSLSFWLQSYLLGCDATLQGELENGTKGFFPANYVTYDLSVELPQSLVEPIKDDKNFFRKRTPTASASVTASQQANPNDPPAGEFVRSKTSVASVDKKWFTVGPKSTPEEQDERKKEWRRGRLMSQNDVDTAAERPWRTKKFTANKIIPSQFREPPAKFSTSAPTPSSPLSESPDPQGITWSKPTPAARATSPSIDPSQRPSSPQPTPPKAPKAPLKKSKSRLVLLPSSLSNLLRRDPEAVQGVGGVAASTSPTAADSALGSRYRNRPLPDPPAVSYVIRKSDSSPVALSGLLPSLEEAEEEGNQESDESVVRLPRKRDSRTLSIATLMNTHREISLPGFLLFQYPTQFKEVSLFGKGGAGEIWEGKLLDSHLTKRYSDAPVAIKFIKTVDWMSEADNLAMFHTEVAVMWSLSFSANIISILGYCESPLAVITKLYPTDLDTLLRDINTVLDYPARFHLMKGLAKSLAATHDLNIAHRDVKPKNVLIEKVDGKYESVLCDFGLAAFSRDHLVQGNNFLFIDGFSVRYAAPEVLSRAVFGVSTLDVEKEKKVDVYSFAITVFELVSQPSCCFLHLFLHLYFTFSFFFSSAQVCRSQPWENLNMGDIEIKVRAGERPTFPRPVPHVVPHVKAMKDLMTACWHQDPDERPDMKKILKRIKDFETTLA